MKIFSLLFSFVLMWQFACASKAELPQNSSPIEIQTAEFEAQKLIESGIKFDLIFNSDTATSDGGTYISHGYKSSDEIKLRADEGIYKRSENADKCFQDASDESSIILKRDSVSDKSGKIEERFVAVSKKSSFYTGEFIIAKKKENNCKIYYSPSLKHLLALEKWRDKN